MERIMDYWKNAVNPVMSCSNFFLNYNSVKTFIQTKCFTCIRPWFSDFFGWNIVSTWMFHFHSSMILNLRHFLWEWLVMALSRVLHMLYNINLKIYPSIKLGLFVWNWLEWKCLYFWVVQLCFQSFWSSMFILRWWRWERMDQESGIVQD